MAITVGREKNKRKYVMAVLGLIVAVIIFMLLVWWGIIIKKEEHPGEPTLPPGFKETEIKWELLENPKIEKLSSFEEIEPYKEKIGRENPFVSYIRSQLFAL